jgi:hypothetical protein
VNHAAHSIGKEHVDLLRLNNGGYFPRPVGWMGQVLSGPIGTSAIVWSARFRTGTRRLWSRGRFERTSHAALGTTNSRDLAALRDSGDDVAALFLTLGAELIDAIAHSVGRLFHLWLFHGHEKQTRCALSTPGTTRSSLDRLD